MNAKKFSDAMSELDSKYIDEALNYKKKGKNPAWVKWGAMAACLCLAVCLAIPILNPKGGPSQSDPFRPLNVIEYNDAYYESVDMTNTEVLDNYNLPHKITADMIGNSLGAGLDADGKQTEQILYQYVPYADIVTFTTELKQERDQRAVYIVEDGGTYSFALFCNFIGFDSNTHAEASEMFAVYGIDEAEDIETVTIGEEVVTDSERISAIFNGITNADSMGNDDYQSAIFKGKSEEAQQALSIELADSAIEIKIVTTEGVAINHILYFPTINYVSWALNYYKLENPIE